MSRASVSRSGRLGNPNLFTQITMTYQSLSSQVLALLGYGKDWLAQHQDNVTEWDMVLVAWFPSRVAL